jgi:hypothetical protein
MGYETEAYGHLMGNAPVINSKPFPIFNKPSPTPTTTISYNPPTGPVGNAPITRPFPTLKPPTSKPTGGLSLSFGLGGGGSSAPVGPNVSLTPQTFAPWESTYTPPTPATPVPYDWATRNPYIYGDGLSNAGAAYDIWGSKPGTNPYLLSTPAGYTPGILGLDPVTLPGNMPNKGANINALSNVKQKDTRTPAQQQWDRIAAYASQEALPKQELKMASDQYAARYGNEIFNNDKAKLAQMFPETNWDNFATPELRAANQVKYTEPMAANKILADKASEPMPLANFWKVAPTEQITSKMNRDYAAPAKQSKAAKAITSYSNKKSTAAPRPTAPAGGYSTKSVNNNFSTRRDVRNIFA